VLHGEATVSQIGRHRSLIDLCSQPCSQIFFKCICTASVLDVLPSQVSDGSLTNLRSCVASNGSVRTWNSRLPDRAKLALINQQG
jgi:hypothetical protein